MAEVLVIGNGGRESALAHAMEASKDVTRTVVSADILDGLEQFSLAAPKPFIIIGPEALLVEGLADELRAAKYTVFGASKQAAKYEASKARATRMAWAADILIPKTFIAEGPFRADAARWFIKQKPATSYVIKADGLASGKGVVLPKTKKEAYETVDEMLSGTSYDGAGSEVINFQHRHYGSEVSTMVVVGSGKEDFVILPLSQDHKRLKDGDKGENTGGMGAYAPVPDSIVSPAQYEKIYQKAYDSLAGMEAEGIIYERAVLYMGLMMDNNLIADRKDDSVLIEYNVRFGDPETQVIMPLLEHAGIDAYRLLRSAAEGSIERPEVDMANIGKSALTVCLAADGYCIPGETVKKGEIIYGTDIIYGANKEHSNITVQLAGAKYDDRHVLRTDGGRVLYVTSVGETIDHAADHAYAAIGENAIYFKGYQYRSDIGWQARKSAAS